jgi:carbon monoxide dehydrogenase subunit G
MRLEGQFRVQAPQDKVYDFLTDPRQVSQHMPDVREVEIDDDDHFTVKARVGISHIKGTMVMKIDDYESSAADSTTVIGKGTGMASVVDMVTGFTLQPADWWRDARELDGRRHSVGSLASFGPQGLLDRYGQEERGDLHRGDQERPTAVAECSPAAAARHATGETRRCSPGRCR